MHEPSAFTLHRIADAMGEIEVDLRFAPLYLSRWRGRLSAEVITALFEFTTVVAKQAIAETGRVAYVNHVDTLERPDAEVRRLIGDLSVEFKQAGYAIMSVGSWQIIGNPLLRGVLRALGWVTNDTVDGRVASSWEEGIAQATAALAAAGQRAPVIDGRAYQFPEQRASA